MLVVYPFNSKDEQQALKNAHWINELKNHRKHRFLVVHDSHCNPNEIKSILQTKDSLSIIDHWNKWPESANKMWSETARYIEYTVKEPWLWVEPDAIPIKENWINLLEDEYLKVGKSFMGAFVPKFKDSPDHMSGTAIYPGEVVKYAGLMLMCVGEPCPFDLIAAKEVVPHTHFTDKIQHRWSPPFNPNPPFTSVEDMKQRITTECVLYHSDKSGSIIDVLRNNLTGGDGRMVVNPHLASVDVCAVSTAEISPAECNHKRQSDQDDATAGQTLLEKRREQAAKMRAAKAAKHQALSVSSPNIMSNGVSVEPKEQQPWENRMDSICEINKLSQRLYKFCDAPMHVKRVRDELKKVGVIR